MIPTEWKCGQDYFLFVQLVSYLVMHPLIKFENAEVLNANYNQISSNSYYKKKLTQETQDSIAKEFKQMLGLRKQKVAYPFELFFSYSSLRFKQLLISIEFQSECH